MFFMSIILLNKPVQKQEMSFLNVKSTYINCRQAVIRHYLRVISYHSPRLVSCIFSLPCTAVAEVLGSKMFGLHQG